MWTNAQRDGRPAEYRWHPLFNAAKFGYITTRVPYSNAAMTRNLATTLGIGPHSSSVYYFASFYVR